MYAYHKKQQKQQYDYMMVGDDAPSDSKRRKPNRSKTRKPDQFRHHPPMAYCMEPIYHQMAHQQMMSQFYHYGGPPRTPRRAYRNPADPIQSPPHTHRVTRPEYPVQARRLPSGMVGNPSLGIYRLRLPPHLMHLLDTIVQGCERHAAGMSSGWLTDLYSLTKQDIALKDVPALYRKAQPIVEHIRRCMCNLWGINDVHLDRNQPHVLKYSADDGHTGVELHHDKCDITANLCMSRKSSYVGGGTLFTATQEIVRLEFGEFVLHPGALVHSGIDIESGTRHLMIIFAQIGDGRKHRNSSRYAQRAHVPYYGV